MNIDDRIDLLKIKSEKPADQYANSYFETWCSLLDQESQKWVRNASNAEIKNEYIAWLEKMLRNRSKETALASELFHDIEHTVTKFYTTCISAPYIDR